MSDLKCRYSELLDSSDVYFPTKTIFMFGDITKENVEKWIKGLHALDSYAGKITVKLNSAGGEVTQCRAMYDALKGCKAKTEGIILGEASSSASIIFQAFTTRIMTPNSEMMIHIGTPSDSGDHPESRVNWAAHEAKIEKWMEDVYLARIKEKKPRFTRKQLKRLLRFDTIMLPREVRDLGLTDKVINDPQ